MKFANGEWYVDQSVHSFVSNSLRISGTINSKTAETILFMLLLWELKNESTVCMQMSLWRTYFNNICAFAGSGEEILLITNVRSLLVQGMKMWVLNNHRTLNYTLGDNIPVFNAFVLRFNKKIEGVSSFVLKLKGAVDCHEKSCCINICLRNVFSLVRALFNLLRYTSYRCSL